MKQTGRIQLILVGIGFASFLAMNSFSLWGFSFLPQFAFGESLYATWSTPLSLSNIAAFFLYFFGSIRFPALCNRPPYLEAVLLLSTGMIFLLGFFLASSSLMLMISGILMGVGTTCCFICWEKVFSQSEQREAQKQIVLGSVASVLPFTLFFAFGQSALLFTVSLLVFFNLILLYLSLRYRPETITEDQNPLEEKERYHKAKQQFWKPLLCIIMIGIVSPVLGSAASSTVLTFFDQSIVVIGANISAAAILGIAWLALDKKITISRTYFVIFPVLITAFLIFPFLQEQYRTGVLFIGSLGFTLFSIVMMMSCITIARERGISLVFVYSLFAGVTYVSRLIGQGVAEIIKNSSLSQETQLITSVFLLLYGCSLVMFVIIRKNASKQVIAQPSGTDVLRETCTELAQQYHLSKRQAEVLDLLVHGFDVPSISKKLFISENTVRSHTKKIYALLDVHSKQEIIGLVNKITEKPQALADL